MPVDDSPLSVTLEAFEGPLDLLLHLIRQHEIDIFDIPIRFITERFLDAIAEMERLDLRVGGEFLVMAATLAQIKSRMLLPRTVAIRDEEDQSDPREGLVRQLVEYQRYKELAERLDERGTLGRDVFARPGPRILAGHRDRKPTRALDLFQLIEAFERVKRRAGFRRRLQVAVARRTVGEEMRRMAELLSRQQNVSFWSAVERDERGEPTVVSIVGVFLAVLEMTRRGLVRVFESSNDPGDLIVEAAVDDLTAVGLEEEWKNGEGGAT